MRQRQRIDREIVNDFPNLPPGCNIQLERVARDRVLAKVRSVLADLNHFIPESIQTWSQESDLPLTFGHFISATGLSPVEVLRQRSWSEWKARAMQEVPPSDPDIDVLRKALPRIALRSDPDLLARLVDGDQKDVVEDSRAATALHYLRWGKAGSSLGMHRIAESVGRWYANPSIVADAAEIAEWRLSHPTTPIRDIALPFPCFLKLHAEYGSAEIK
jgi:hypothetical protein